MVIAAGQSTSSAAELVGDTIVGLYMPAAWDAADLAFQASPDGTNFSPMSDFGAAVSVKAAAGQYVPLDVTKFIGVSYVRVQSHSGGTPVNQTAARVILPVFRGLE
jgi:hypothetical protein